MFPQRKQNIDADDFVAKLTSQMQKAHDTARTTLKTSLKRMKRNYDLRILERQYEEGDVVYLLDSATLKGKCKKLCSPWKGPAVIVKKLSVSLFRVKLRNAIFVVNHDRLKPCHDRNMPAWIQQWQQKPVDADSSTDEDKALYCLCRKPWQGRFMIQCDYCDEWYHGSCVNITASDALDIDKYKCTTCKGR
jgi:ketosteroid isomerase-like protein